MGPETTSADYDVIIIGSGTAGQTAAYELNREGLKIAVVEHSDRPGGTCALYGCQAKKWFYEAAEIVSASRRLDGIGITSLAAGSWGALRDAKNKFTEKVPPNTLEGLEEAGIDYISGRARFLNETSIAAGERTLTARYFVVAAGARPSSLPIPGSRHLMTSTEFMEIDSLPERIVFVGGGFISFEFAHFAKHLGGADTDCAILEAGPRPLAAFDQQMVDLLQNATVSDGIRVECNIEISDIVPTTDGVQIHLKDGRRIDGDIAVHGAGRIPDIDELDLDKAGVAADRKGITVNEFMATDNSRIYAAGDCAATIQLARVADAEARVAAGSILRELRGKTSGQVSGNQAADNESPSPLKSSESVESPESMSGAVIPAVLFTTPQYGMVGKTEGQLKEQGISYTKSEGEQLSWPTYRRVGLRTAAYKILVGDSGEILGAHILSDNSTGLIAVLALAMKNGISAKDLHSQSTLLPYPSRESDLLYMLAPFSGG